MEEGRNDEGRKDARKEIEEDGKLLCTPGQEQTKTLAHSGRLVNVC